MEIEQYGEETDNLPTNTGFFWAFPSVISTPAAQDWEIGLFLPYSKNVAQKTKGSYMVTGEIDFPIGARPSATRRSDIL